MCPLSGRTSIGGVDEAGRPDDLLDDPLRDLPLERSGGRRDEHGLGNVGEELGELERAVVPARREPPAELDQVVLAAPVALVHPLELGDASRATRR